MLRQGELRLILFRPMAWITAGSDGTLWRAARPVDGDLLPLFGSPIFGYSGAATGEIAPAKDHGGATLISHDDFVRAAERELKKSDLMSRDHMTSWKIEPRQRLGGYA